MTPEARQALNRYLAARRAMRRTRGTEGYGAALDAARDAWRAYEAARDRERALNLAKALAVWREAYPYREPTDRELARFAGERVAVVARCRALLAAGPHGTP